MIDRLRLNYIDFQEVIIHGNNVIHALNNLPYPGDYIWNQNSTENIITGTKTFSNVLSKFGIISI